MKVTNEMLKCWDACKGGYDWFNAHFPSGEAEYQTILNALAEDDQPSYANWLMDHAGPDNTVLEVDSIIDCKNLFFAGRIVIKGNATITKYLRAGTSIEAGLGIKAGDDFGIFAGFRLQISNWNFYAKVAAKSKPENLISGYWIEPESEK